MKPHHPTNAAPLAKQLWLALRLIIRPRELARSSMVISLPNAAAIFALACGLLLTMALTPGFMSIGEPYASVREYFLQAANPAIIFVAFLLSAPFLGGASLVLAARAHRSPDLWPSDRVSLVACLLAPVPLLLPAAAWVPLGAIAQLSDPTMSIMGPVPPWMTAPWMPILGSPLWFVLFIAAGVRLAVRAVREVQRMLPHEGPPPICRACGYDLAGLTARVCPECGAPAEPTAPNPSESPPTPRGTAPPSPPATTG